jgi:hypothetical protein
MSRWLVSSIAMMLLAGCTLPPEQLPLKPLPEDGTPMAYVDLATRTRAQVDAAREAFYEDNWPSLEEAGRVLERTAGLLVKTTDVPQRQKDTLAVDAGDLNKEATHLRESAKAKDVKGCNDSLQQLHLLVRKLTVTK